MDQFAGLWLMLALVNAELANIDGRSPLTYFVGSLILGPVPTIALAVTKYDPQEGTRLIDIMHGRSGVAARSTKISLWISIPLLLVLTAIFGYIRVSQSSDTPERLI